MSFAAKPLDATTWGDFARLAEDHRGVWNGCWCLGFHEEGRNGLHSRTGALAEISRHGGGLVESYPEDTAGRRVSGSFLNNGTVAMFERPGFTRTRQIGKHHWVVTQVIS